LDLNILPDGRHMAEDVRDFFLSHGAAIERRRIYLPPRSASLRPA
jgi:hypothetical protein